MRARTLKRVVALALLAAATPATATPEPSLNDMLRLGFTTADIRDAELAAGEPYRTPLLRWFQCLNGKALMYLANGWSAQDTMDTTRLLCSNEEATLRSALTGKIGRARAARVIAIFDAKLRQTLEQGLAARKRAAAPPAAQPATPAGPVTSTQAKPTVPAGTWRFEQATKTTLCGADFYNEGSTKPDVQVFRYQKVLGLDFTQSASPGRVVPDEERRRVILYRRDTREEHVLTFRTIVEDGRYSIVLVIPLDGLIFLQGLDTVWIDPAAGEEPWRGRYYALPELPAAVEHALTC